MPGKRMFLVRPTDFDFTVDTDIFVPNERQTAFMFSEFAVFAYNEIDALAALSDRLGYTISKAEIDVDSLEDWVFKVEDFIYWDSVENLG